MILLVDDEEEFLEEVLEMLSRHAIPAIGECNPFRAVQLVFERPEINLIIADWQMPLLDGLALMSKVQRDRGEKIIFIIMTGHEGDRGTQLAKEHGAAMVLRKPFEQTELINALERVGWSTRGFS